MQTGGNDLNSGSTNSNTSAYTSTSGNWSTVTGIFTPTDGSTPASTVNIGDYVSIYLNAASAAVALGLVSAVGAGVNGTITVGTTAVCGAYPVTGSGTVSLKAGGAWASCAVWTSMFAAQTATISTCINIKAGTYANTTTSRTFGLNGTATIGVLIRGYKTTIGDQVGNYAAVTGTDIPSITFTTGRLSTGTRQTWQNMDITGAATLSTVLYLGQCEFNECRISTTSSVAGSACMANSGSVAIGLTACKFTGTTTNTTLFSNSGGSSAIHGCTFTSGISAITTAAQTLVAEYCMFDSQQGDAIAVTSGFTQVSHCGFYAAVGNGINWSTTPANNNRVANCYFSTITTGGKAAIMNSSGTNTDLIKDIANAFFNCAANRSGYSDGSVVMADNGTLASEAFVAPASQNFAIAAVGQGIGYPGPFEGVSTYRGYLDVGPAQHQGSGGLIVHQDMTGGCGA